MLQQQRQQFFLGGAFVPRRRRRSVVGTVGRRPTAPNSGGLAGNGGHGRSERFATDGKPGRQFIKIHITPDGVRYLCHESDHGLGYPGAAVGAVQIRPFRQGSEQIVKQRSRAIDKGRPLLRRLTDEIIGVLSGRQFRNAQFQGFRLLQNRRAGLLRRSRVALFKNAPGRFQAAQGGVASGRVAVESHGDLGGQPAHQINLSFGERRAHGRHHVVKPVLVGHHGVHVAFDDNRAMLTHRLFGQVHGEQDAGFVKHGRSRSVQIFWSDGIIQGAAAEPGDSRFPVPNGDHQAAPEQVVIAPVISLPSQAGFGDQFRFIPGPGEMGQQAVVAGWAVAELKDLQ